MAAGPVGIAGGVFGGRPLLVEIFTADDDGGDGIIGFKLGCLFARVFPSMPFPPNDSQLSFRGRPTVAAVCAVDVRLEADRVGRG